MRPQPADLETMVEPPARPVLPVRLLLACRFFALLVLLGIVSLAWSALALVLRWVLPVRHGRRIGRLVICNVYRAFWACARWCGLMRMDATELDALRGEPGGLVVAANHPSMLDAMLIVSRLPRSACVMKGALRYNPFLGPGAELAGYVANDALRPMVRDSVQCLEEGCHLVVFPEGTRSPGPGRLHPFHRSIALIALRARAPVQAVVIETDSPYLGKGWPIWKMPPFPIVFRARLGQRFEPSGDAEQLSTRMEEYFHQELRP